MLSRAVISYFQVHVTLYFKSHAETGTKLDNETWYAVCYASANICSFHFILTSLLAAGSDSSFLLSLSKSIMFLLSC